MSLNNWLSINLSNIYPIICKIQNIKKKITLTPPISIDKSTKNMVKNHSLLALKVYTKTIQNSKKKHFISL